MRLTLLAQQLHEVALDATRTGKTELARHRRARERTADDESSCRLDRNQPSHGLLAVQHDHVVTLADTPQDLTQPSFQLCNADLH